MIAQPFRTPYPPMFENAALAHYAILSSMLAPALFMAATASLP
jgi:hypothetical protein